MFWALLLILLSLASGLFVILWHRSRREETLKRRLCIEHLRLLRRLIELLQQHRGLSYGVGSGERSLEKRLWSVTQQLDALFTEATELAWNLSDPDAWQSIEDDWQWLREAFTSTPPEVLLAQHSQCIGRLLDVMEDLGARHDLIDQGRVLTPPAGLWFRILGNTELMGQARALGTGIAAHRANTPLARERLQQLHRLISQHAYQPLAAVDSDPSLASDLGDRVRVAEDSLDRYLESIERLLSGQGTQDESSLSFYLCATEAIGAQMLLIDLMLEYLRQQH